MSQKQVKIGVIGGSGLYQFPGLEDVYERIVETPFGSPSDNIVEGRFQGVSVCFLPRHGRGHRFLPSEVNYCANIAALKLLDCTHVLSVSAVGSMKEEIPPGDLVLVDQFIDWTKGKRRSTFFGDGIVGHVAFADPVCTETRSILFDCAKRVGLKIHNGGTYLCIEGPQFSMKAESHLYRSFGVSVIGMTNVPECKLAREAGLSYATIAMATDYDCWHEGHDSVTVEQVVATMNKNVENVKKLIAAAIPEIARKTTLPYSASREAAIMTAPQTRDPKTLQRLKPILFE